MYSNRVGFLEFSTPGLGETTAAGSLRIIPVGRRSPTSPPPRPFAIPCVNETTSKSRRNGNLRRRTLLNRFPFFIFYFSYILAPFSFMVPVRSTGRLRLFARVSPSRLRHVYKQIYAMADELLRLMGELIGGAAYRFFS